MVNHLKCIFVVVRRWCRTEGCVWHFGKYDYMKLQARLAFGVQEMQLSVHLDWQESVQMVFGFVCFLKKNEPIKYLLKSLLNMQTNASDRRIYMLCVIVVAWWFIRECVW